MWFCNCYSPVEGETQNSAPSKEEPETSEPMDVSEAEPDKENKRYSDTSCL